MTVTSPDPATSLLWALNAKRLIGRRVSQAMKDAGYENDEALARDAEVTVKTVWRLRNGKAYPREETARKVAAALGIPTTELRPPQTPDEEPEIREQLSEVLSRLQRIETELGTAPPIDPDAEAADLEADEEAEARRQSGSTDAPSEAPGREAAK